MARPQDVRIRFQGQDNTKGAFRSIQRNTRALSSTLLAFSAGLGGGFLTIFTGAGLLNAVRSLTTEFDALQKKADEFGISAQALQSLQLAAELGGGGVDQLNRAFTRILRGAQQARDGLASYQRIFESINVDPFELAALSTEEAIFRIAEGFAGAANQVEAYARFAELTSTRNSVLFQTFKNLAINVADAERRVNELGGTLDEEVLRKNEEVNDRLTVLSQAFRNRFIGAAVDLKEFAVDAGESILRADNALVQWTDSVNQAVKEFLFGVPAIEAVITKIDEFAGVTERANQAAIDQALAIASDQEALQRLANQYRQVQAASEAREAQEEKEGEKRRQNLLTALRLGRSLITTQSQLRPAVGREVDSRRLGLGGPSVTQDPQVQALNKLIKKEEEKQIVGELRKILATLQEQSFKAVAS